MLSFSRRQIFTSRMGLGKLFKTRNFKDEDGKNRGIMKVGKGKTKCTGIEYTRWFSQFCTGKNRNCVQVAEFSGFQRN